jgi:ribosomal protein L29
MGVNMKTKTIKELEKELEELKESHRSMCDIYGSELCTGDMIRQEEKLKKKILKLKTIKRWKEKGLLKGVPLQPTPMQTGDLKQIIDD